MQTPKPRFIVGIGGSAGGLDAYMKFLDALPEDTGMAFVIISHILPTESHSLLAEILAKHTKMPVRVTAAEMPVRPDHVYVIAPNVDLRIEDYTFKPTAPRTMNKQVDIFLTSLASAMGEHAIGIIFSGYDGDGSQGCMEIKLRGGTTFAQDSSAIVNGMPVSAQRSGYVDHVLPPGEMGAALEKWADAFDTHPSGFGHLLTT